MCGILAKGNENPDIEYLENVIKALVEQVEESGPIAEFERS